MRLHPLAANRTHRLAQVSIAEQVVDRGGVGELKIKYATLEQLDELCRKLTARG